MDTQEMNSAQDTTAEALPMKLDVGVRPIVPKGNLVAFASVKINDCFVVDGIKIVTGEKGPFVDMPSAPDGKGGYRDTAFPVTAEFRNQLNDAVLAGYAVAIEKMQDKVQAAEKTVRDISEKPSIMGKLSAAKEAQAGQPAKAAPTRDEGAR